MARTGIAVLRRLLPAAPLCVCGVLLSFSWCGLAAPAPSPKRLLGFSQEGSDAERALEAKFDSLLCKENLREWMQRLTAHPHHLGSPHGKEVADFIASQFRAWGYETEIEQFDVLFPTPKVRLLEMTAPERFTAGLAEAPLKEDATSGLIQEQLPTYNAYSIDGDVTAPLVYVNYGVPRDYETLAERGLDVKGKIVIARYGGSWRGIKPKVAAEHGAVACLIYSDPREEGYFEGDVYPKGAWRNEHGVERGSVADLPVYPGDPLTPGTGATKDAKRLAVKDAPTLTRIPVLPISYADALPLLRALSGPVAPESWRGALPITYHLGPGPATVHLHLEFNWQMTPAFDVIAKLAGSERPEEWVIRGNHHDAWVYGAEDPVSGTVSVLEEARVMGQLAKDGWKPKRTLVFAAWDGEEPGLLGSTEWVETHAHDLREHAVAYINGDNNARGFLRVGGSHTLEKFVSGVAADVTDPEKQIPVGERLRARAISTGSAEERREWRQRADLKIRALGSGSDYSPFLQHLGIASLDLRYGGEGDGGSYHSIYDSYDYFTRFIDPDFEYGIALAQTAGRAVLRLANAEILPFEFKGFADAVAGYVKELVKLADDLREETRESNRLIDDKTLEWAADPSRKQVLPPKRSPVPHFSFAPLHNAVDHLREAASRFEEQMDASTGKGEPLSPEKERALDQLFMESERVLTRPEGLPGRAWYRHLIYAPGAYTGYGVKTLPGVREALEERQWSVVNEQIALAAKVLEAYAAHVDEGRRILSKAE